jgi:hypothetical protein
MRFCKQHISVVEWAVGRGFFGFFFALCMSPTFSAPAFAGGGVTEYSSGITPPGLFTGPAGPVSNSAVAVPPPGGPGFPLNRLGDSYVLVSGGFLQVETVRIQGFMGVEGSILVEFWDAGANFVGEFAARICAEPETYDLEVGVPLVIPPMGFMTIRIRDIAPGDVLPEATFFWFGTDMLDVGGNFPGTLWVNSAPAAPNFLVPAPGILAFEIVGFPAPAPIGGCCDGAGGCSNELSWICLGSGDNFQGVGNLCHTCRFGVDVGMACGTCSVAGDPCITDDECPAGETCDPTDDVCDDGPPTCSNNDEDACVMDAECVGRPFVCSNIDRPCVVAADCPPGGVCGGPGTCAFGFCATLDACSLGACCPPLGGCVVTDEAFCVAFMGGLFGGPGTDCEPNCCPQPADPVADGSDATPYPSAPGDIYDANCTNGICYTGADDCADAVVGTTHVVPDLDPADPPFVLTITGNNVFASATEFAPDSCFGVAEELEDEQGWWEAFALTGTCTNVRIDTCCSAPRRSSYAFLATDCACEGLMEARLNADGAVSGFGDPVCEDGNQWVSFGSLPAGVYYYPVVSSGTGVLGPYQMHVTAEACPEAACCLAGGGCVDGVNHVECSALGGYLLAPPNVDALVPVCLPVTCPFDTSVDSAPLLPDPTGAAKNRFISFGIDPSGEGEVTALRVELAALRHVCGAGSPVPGIPCDAPADCAPGPCVSPYPDCEGEYRYVNSFVASADPVCDPLPFCLDSPAFGVFYRCATLGTEPEYRDWASDLGGALLHVTGNEVVPGYSEYLVANLPTTCQGIEVSCEPEPLLVTTARWGDVVGVGGVTPPNGITNVLDIAAVVDKVRDIAGSVPESRALLNGGNPNPLAISVNAADIGRAVDAVRGFAYPFGVVTVCAP